MSAAERAMQSWLSSLALGGVISRSFGDEETGMAAMAVGVDTLKTLRDWMRHASREEVIRERRGAIESCISMAHADREISADERLFLSRLVGHSLLDEDTQDELVGAVHDPPSLQGIEDKLTRPALRELIIALAWELANADGVLDQRESDFHIGLAKRLEVSPERAAKIREAVVQVVRDSQA